MTGDYLIDTLSRLCTRPSAVPLGPKTLIDPDDPLLVDYVQDGLRPEFIAAGAYDIIDLPLNQLAVRFGNGDGPCLALFAYTPTQHNNLMQDPWSGRIRVPIERGVDEACVFGQGVSQNKAHQACLLDLARWLIRERVELGGTLWLCVNNEGRSSHQCSYAILDHLPRPPDLVVQLFPTDFRVSVGNRGRLDVYVHVHGESAHSSNPPYGRSVIDVASEVVRRVNALDVELRGHEDPRLGREHAVAYQVVYEPVAPHTIPSYAKVTVDRRLLPGTTEEMAVDELRRALSTLSGGGHVRVEVEPGVVMLPAVLPEDVPGLRALDEAIAAHLGGDRPLDHYCYPGTFDAGGPLSRGVPTVMFGLGGEGDLLGDDFVRISAVHREALILRDFVRGFFRVR